MIYIQSLITMLFDILPIILVILIFQLLIIKQKIPNLKKIIIGFIMVWVGLSLFVIGLKQALFPLGEMIAIQLTSSEFIPDNPHWSDYYLIYIFAFCIGFATTIAEPALIAITIEANKVSNGKISADKLRIIVAIGVALAITVGSYRIVADLSLQYFIIGGYLIVLLQSYFAKKNIISLAYDLGAATTSMVTVPIVAALGFGLSTNVKHSQPLVDSFGLIAFASLFPVMAVLLYAQFKKK